MRHRGLDIFFLTLVIIGAVNWGLIGFFGFDLVAAMFGGMATVLSRSIYAIVGIAGIYAITLYRKIDDEVEVKKF